MRIYPQTRKMTSLNSIKNKNTKKELKITPTKYRISEKKVIEMF